LKDNLFYLTPVTGMVDVRVRSVAAAEFHCLALRWDGRVYSWGDYTEGQLGHGDLLGRNSPARDRFKSIDSEDAQDYLSRDRSLRPVLVDGLEGVRVRQVLAKEFKAFAIGEDGELFTWGEEALGDGVGHTSPRRMEALRGIPVISVACRGFGHALVLSEDGLVYELRHMGRLDPVEALRGVRVGSIATGAQRCYAVSVTGELWAWAEDPARPMRLGHDGRLDHPVPQPIEPLPGVKVCAVMAWGGPHAFVVMDGGDVFWWGAQLFPMEVFAGLGSLIDDVGENERMPRRIPGLRLACERMPRRIPGLRLACGL
jgi:alpha-tubulin suppressor-like RCC1 family protein